MEFNAKAIIKTLPGLMDQLDSIDSQLSELTKQLKQAPKFAKFARLQELHSKAQEQERRLNAQKVHIDVQRRSKFY